MMNTQSSHTTWSDVITEGSLVVHAFADECCVEPDVIGTLNLLPKQLILAFPCQPTLLLQLQKHAQGQLTGMVS